MYSLPQTAAAATAKPRQDGFSTTTPVTPPAQPRMRRYLPLAVAATTVVIVLPAIAVAALVPSDGVLKALGSAGLAVAISLGLAAMGAASWKRQPRSRDVVFAELMLWCWVRRCWTERRLSQARELFDSARKAGPLVNIELLLGLSRLLEARDAYLHGHSQRVARHAVRIARAMGLSPREIAKIRTAAEVHDVGKLYTPRAILNSPYPLSDEEFEVVKQHAPQGAEMVRVVGDPEITAIVRHHHERIDGGGYPDGLAGAAIPLGARIVAVADTFDAITSDRAYRAAGSQKHALEVLASEQGAQLDADAVSAFLQGYSARRSVTWYAAGTVVVQRAVLALQSLSSNLGIGLASVGALAPALGAAGVLAVSPGLFRESRAVVHPPSSAPARSLALAQAPHDSGSAGSGHLGKARRGSSNEARRPLAQLEPRGQLSPGANGPRSLTQGGSGGSPMTPSGAPAASGAGVEVPRAGPTSGEGTPPTGSSAGSPITRPGGGVPRIPSPPSGPVTVPSPSTPEVSTPAVTTPSISTPTIATPSVSAAGVTVPSVTVPSVTVPGVTVPSVKLPSVKLGGG